MSERTRGNALFRCICVLSVGACAPAANEIRTTGGGGHGGAPSSRATQPAVVPEPGVVPEKMVVTDSKPKSFMFVQTSSGSTVEPIHNGNGSFRLTLRGVQPNTVYFSDRPERVAGNANNEKFLKGLNFSPKNPPNAAVVLSQPGNDKAITTVVELTEPKYDSDLRTLVYVARPLSSFEGTKLQHWANERPPVVSDGDYGLTSVFIDDCPDMPVQCFGDVQCQGGEDGQCCPIVCGTGEKVGYCWNPLTLSCGICNDHSDQCDPYCGEDKPLCTTCTTSNNVCL